jgi:hypothetical protein
MNFEAHKITSNSEIKNKSDDYGAKQITPNSYSSLLHKDFEILKNKIKKLNADKSNIFLNNSTS